MQIKKKGKKKKMKRRRRMKRRKKMKRKKVVSLDPMLMEKTMTGSWRFNGFSLPICS